MKQIVTQIGIISLAYYYGNLRNQGFHSLLLVKSYSTKEKVSLVIVGFFIFILSGFGNG